MHAPNPNVKCNGQHMAQRLQCHLQMEHCIKIAKAISLWGHCTHHRMQIQWIPQWMRFSTNQSITNHERFQSSHIISHMLHQALRPSPSLNWETTLIDNDITHPFVCHPPHCWRSLWRERQGIVAWVRIFVDYAYFASKQVWGIVFLKQCIALDHIWVCLPHICQSCPLST